MPGLSNELVARCYTVLRRCNQLESRESLQAFFIRQELYPFRDRLPDFLNDKDFISRVVAYLLDQTTDTQPVFPNFILALRPDDSTDELYSDLEQLYQQITSELGLSSRLTSDNSVKIPYVVAAMNKDELDDFQKGNYLDAFKEFLPDLPLDWAKHYDKARDNWRLHSDPDRPIAEVIDEVFKEAEANQEHQKVCIVGESYSEDFFDPQRRGPVWLDMQNSTGILVIDAISLFYCPLFEVIKDTQVASSARMAVLIFSPVFHKLRFTQLVREMLETSVAKDTAHILLQDYCSGRYEIGAWNLYGVQRWLYTTLPSVVENVRMYYQKRNTRTAFGPNPKRAGIHNTFWGRKLRVK